MPLTAPLTLSCGLEIPNRIAKAAMTEGLAEAAGHAGERIERAYRTWADGGSGLILTGNIMVDGRYRERPANVIVDGEQDEAGRAGLRRFAEAAKSGGGATIAQISHAGRQSPKAIAAEPVGPSAVAMKMPGGLFGKPRALTVDEIHEVVGQTKSTRSSGASPSAPASCAPPASTASRCTPRTVTWYRNS